MLSVDSFNRAQRFIYENARLLDRRRFEYHFGQGSKAAVIKALTGFQNEDGGFGQALEPDIRCPHSQPVPTEVALSIMQEIDEYDRELIVGIGSYLKSVTVGDTGGFPLIQTSANEYPHAPWWTVADDRHASINPTGHILGYLMKQHTVPELTREEWFQQAEQFMWNQLEAADNEGYHSNIQYISFLIAHPDKERAVRALQKVNEWLQLPGVIERNTKAEGYVHKVLDWAPTRDSYCAQFVTEEETEEHLQSLVEEQQEDGGWPISWPAVSPAGEMEWRGYVTVNRLLTLKSYGWLQR